MKRVGCLITENTCLIYDFTPEPNYTIRTQSAITQRNSTTYIKIYGHHEWAKSCMPGEILQTRKTRLLLVSIDMEHLWGMFHVKKRTGCSNNWDQGIDVMVTGGQCNNRLRGLEVPAMYTLLHWVFHYIIFNTCLIVHVLQISLINSLSLHDISTLLLKR